MGALLPYVEGWVGLSLYVNETDWICGTFATKLIRNSFVDVETFSFRFCFSPAKSEPAWYVFN